MIQARFREVGGVNEAARREAKATSTAHGGEACEPDMLAASPRPGPRRSAMSHDDLSLLDTLRALEVELHHPGVRSSAERLSQLLHPDFHEVGRSGRQYDRETIIRWLRVAPIAPDAALLTYRSAHRQQDGSLAHHTLRSSLWLKTSQGWQMRYHQGTPAAQPW